MGRASPLLLICAAVLMPLCAAAQHAEYLDSQRIEAAVDRLFDPLTPDALSRDAGAIMADFGLAWAAPVLPQVKPVAFAPGAGAVVELVDIRLLLTQIAIQTGARDHAALVRAQGDRAHTVILLRGGTATLGELMALSRGTAVQDFITQTPEGTVLTRPLAIWSDAGLSLQGADHLILDRASGSFVANLGQLDLSGGAISGSTGTNTTVPTYRPFVMTAGQGSFTARSAAFAQLGFGDAAVFGGIAIANNGLKPPVLSSSITDSTMKAVKTVGFIGTSGAILVGNDITASGGTAVLVSKARETVVAQNTLATLSGSQAIRVTAGAEEVQISGNLLSGAAGIGILIDRDSHDVAVEGNLVIGSLTTGIGVQDASCVTIAGNLVAANGGNGISLGDSDAVVVGTNALLFNRAAGVLVRDQASAAQVQVTQNVFVGNRVGLRGATVGRAAIAGNDLDGQMPRVFAGDFALLTVDWLRARRDATPVVMPAPAAAPCLIPGEG